MSDPVELVPGLWRWTRRHPEWDPGAFGAEVGSYAVVGGGHAALRAALDTEPWFFID